MHGPSGRIVLLFHCWLGLTNRFVFCLIFSQCHLPRREENPAWLTLLAAQVTARVGLGEWGEMFVSLEMQQILHIKQTEKANLLPVQKSW